MENILKYESCIDFLLEDKDILKMNPKLGNFSVGYEYFLLPMGIGYKSEFTIWYPTTDKPERQVFHKIFPFECKKNASIAFQKLSTIIISHGSGGTQYDQLYLVKFLVSHGYAVITVQHRYKDIKNNAGWEFLLGLPNDINAVIKWIENYNVKNLFDIDRISIIGFSAGCFASLLIAGAKPDFNDKNFERYLASIGAVDYSVFYNQRVKAIVLMAPPLANLFPMSELQRLKIPILILAAGNDEVCNKNNVEHYRVSISSLVAFINLVSAGHYSFNNEVYHTFLKKINLTNNNNSGKIKIDFYHNAINQYCLQFMNQYL